MRIAIPVENTLLSAHFGHCEEFAMVTVEENKVVERERIKAPRHQPGLFPRWLGSLGANVIIAGGMGHRAIQLFEQNGIEVVVGAPSVPVEELVEAYLSGSLVSTGGGCAGGQGNCGDHH